MDAMGREISIDCTRLNTSLIERISPRIVSFHAIDQVVQASQAHGVAEFW